MYRKDSAIVASIASGIDNMEYEVTVFYDKGGINYFNCATNRRGYYISAKPITIRDNCKSFIIFSGIKELIAECKAFNANKFTAIVNSITPANYEHLIQVVKVKEYERELNKR